MTYTALIVDDEPLARQVVRNYIKDYPDISIAGECDNGKDAVDKIRALSPHIVFLDIQMPELSGMEVIEKLDQIPHIVFSTAYDEYAIKAFEMNAVDYLLKPFDKNRFDKTIQRLRKQLQTGQRDQRDIQQFSALMDDFKKPEAYLERILVPHTDQMILLPVKDIIYIESQENYISIVSGSDSFLLFQKISVLEKKLNPRDFFRIHRSYIVNISFIETIEAWFKSSFKVILKNGEELPMSRRKAKAFKGLFA